MTARRERRPSSPRQHNPRACRLWRRPRIRNGFLHFAATKFVALMQVATPFAELRRLVDDAVPATGAPRRRGVRSDLIESICLVVYCLLARLDLKSLRVGWHSGQSRKHDFVGLSRETLAAWSGLSIETVSMVLTLLRRAGLVHGPGKDGVNIIRQPVEETPEGFDYLPAIRRVDLRFFEGLNLGAWLHEIRTGKAPQISAAASQPAVGPKSVRGLVGELANTRALERPPDG